jgi:pimeloyl-ACP methyl ester carboxylesterase
VLRALAVLRGLALGFLLLGPVVLPASAGAQQPSVTARDYRAPSVSAKDGSPLTLALTEKHRADRDPDALAAGGRLVLVTHGSSYSGQAGVDVQVPGVPAEQSYSMLDQLALRGYDAWTLAYQDYGRSDRHDCGLCVTTEAASGDVEAAVRFILARRGAGRLHLIGWSWGGETAGLFVQRHPELVNRLGLYAPVLDRQEGDPPTEQFRTNTEAGLGRVFSPAGAVPEVVSAFVQAALALDPQPPNGVLLDWRSDPLKMDPRRLTLPTLVIYGADDVITPVSGPNVRPFFERLAAAEKKFVVVPEAGHAFFMERQREHWYDEVLGHLEPGSRPVASAGPAAGAPPPPTAVPAQVPGQLPRTGVLPWPVLPVLLAGVAILAVGTLLRRQQ